jgi:hypothetical protein
MEDTEWPDIDGEIILELQGIIITGGTNPSMRQEEEDIIHECKQRMRYVKKKIRAHADSLRANKADDDVYKDYVNGNIRGVFRRVFPKKGYAAGATTPDQYSDNGKTKAVKTSREARLAEEQKRAKLYCKIDTRSLNSWNTEKRTMKMDCHRRDLKRSQTCSDTFTTKKLY